jgi:hypothetical protein
MEKSQKDVIVCKYGLVNCFEEMAILSVSHDVCVRVNEARNEVNDGYLRVVLRMGLLFLVELSQQEVKHCLVTYVGCTWNEEWYVMTDARSFGLSAYVMGYRNCNGYGVGLLCK